MIVKLKRFIKPKSCLHVFLSVTMLLLLYFFSNCMKENTLENLKRIQNARDSAFLYGEEIKTHDGQSLSTSSGLDDDGSSSQLESSKIQSEEGEEYDIESIDNDTYTAVGDSYSEGNGGEISEGDVMRTSLVVSSGQPVVVIILAQWRFGSSIIGELFNQNPGIFFLYEPLWIVEQMVRMWRLPGAFTPESYYYSQKLLRDFARCNFSDEFMDIVNLTNHWGGKYRNRVVCQRLEDADCNIPNASWLRDVCLSFEGHLAAKLIRGDLNTIKPLIVDDRANVKVVHLVRDPRGSAASRINYMYKVANNELAHPNYSREGRLEPLKLMDFKDKQSDSIQGMCQWVRETTFPKDQTPEWLQDRYYRLRYEDFSEDPLRTTEDLYNFAGIDLPESVRKWVARNTQAERSASGTFDTKKNSSLTAKHWIYDLSPVEIQQVEARCSDVMEILGYEPYEKLQQK